MKKYFRSLFTILAVFAMVTFVATSCENKKDKEGDDTEVTDDTEGQEADVSADEPETPEADVNAPKLWKPTLTEKCGGEEGDAKCGGEEEGEDKCGEGDEKCGGEE
jgi:hypothetical protein